jgi:hypothetical protein
VKTSWGVRGSIRKLPPRAAAIGEAATVDILFLLTWKRIGEMRANGNQGHVKQALYGF